LSRSEDIEELFGEIGALKSVSLLTKEDGSSRGMALVVFKRKADAETALEKYNGVPLDGRPLKISLQSNLTPVSATTPRGGKGAGADAVQIISGRGGGRVVTVEGGGKGGEYHGEDAFLGCGALAARGRGVGRIAGGEGPMRTSPRTNKRAP
jgi:THO complex subunit 4